MSSTSSMPSFPSSSSISRDYSHGDNCSCCRNDGISMRVFLVQTARGLFSSSGGYRANITMLRYLASRGHSVRQLCYHCRDEVDNYVQHLSERCEQGINRRSRTLILRGDKGAPDTVVNVEELVMDDLVEIIALESETFDLAFGGEENMAKKMVRETSEYIENGKLSARLSGFVSFLQKEIRSFLPTHIISNDGLSMQASSAQEMPDLDMCRIGVVHTAEQLPFGPFAGGILGHVSSPKEDDLLRRLDGIWSVSKAIKRYALEHGQLQTSAFNHHPWTYLEEKKHEMPTRLYNWDKKFVGMVNPCAVKGSQILINLCEVCPQFEFLVYKSWGFDDNIAKQMRHLRNLTIRPACTNMEEAWRSFKVLLVPSIWFEAWGIVVVEAHLHGIPVISSNAGALPEAMLGSDYIVPVNTIEGQRNEEGAYILPQQDTALWVKTLNKIMNDESEYKRLSMEVREKTVAWLRSMDEAALENWLMGLMISS